MTKYRTFLPHDALPADWPDALGEFLGASVHNLVLQLKPGDPTTLQIPAAADNGQASIAINGRWRYNSATVERASLGGSARLMDVYVTAADNSFAPGDPEIDSTVYSFAMAIVEHGAIPGGVALSRQIAVAQWTGAAFVTLQVLVPTVLPAPPTLVAVLPPNPFDGQEIYFLADAANGVIFHLRYRASSPNPQKWETVGGSALYAAQGGGSTQTTADASTYVAMTSGPSLTVPLSGVYDVLASGDIYYNGSGGTAVDARVQVAGSIEGLVSNPGFLSGYAEPGGLPPAPHALLANTQGGATRQFLNAGTVLSLRVATNNVAVSFGIVAGWSITARAVRVG